MIQKHQTFRDRNIPFTRIIKNSLILSLIFLCVHCLQPATIKGFVKDAATGEPVLYANVYLQETDYGTTSLDEGYFVLTDIPAASYQLAVSFIGYEQYVRSINIEENKFITINVTLIPKPISFSEVTVNARKTLFNKNTNVSSIPLSTRDVKQSPFFLENDLIKVIQALPGVTSTSDFSSQLYVRGGSGDQNLIQLDGVQIFNPIHFGGLFSVFDADAVQRAQLLAGGFPAEYGGRLSSVLDVYTTTGNPNKTQGIASLSILSSKLVFDGPIPFMNGTYFISGRRTYFDKVLPYFDRDFPYYFYDLYAKVAFESSDDTKIFISNFVNYDEFDFKEGGEGILMSWGNKVTSLSIRHLISPRLFSRTYLTRSQFSQDINIESEQELTSIVNTIDEYSLKSDITGFVSPTHQVKTGIEIRRKEWVFDGSFMGGGMLYEYDGTPTLSSLYFQDKWMPIESIIIQPGVRLNYYSVNFQQGKNYTHTTVTPRLSAKYFLTKNFAINAAYGKYSQFGTNVHLMGDEGFLGSTFYNWYPIWGKYEPSKSNHYILGIEHWISESINLTLEGYYKTYNQLYKYDIAGFDTKDPLNTLYLEGNGESAGMDFLLKKDLGKVTGWISYSLGLAVVEFEGDRYYPIYDRRQNLNIILNFPLVRKFNFSAKFNYGSGAPYNYYSGRYRRYWFDEVDGGYGDWWDDMESVRKRYPSYSRLDILLTKNYKWEKIDFLLKIGVINVLNHKNVFLYYRDHSFTPPTLNRINMLPIFPSIELKIKF